MLCEFYLDEAGTVMLPASRTYDTPNYEIESANRRGHEDISVIQFTGLLDKHGKEIYEGDILKNSYRAELTIVKWRDLEAQYSIGGYQKETVEIIGNIYENPELLTK